MRTIFKVILCLMYANSIIGDTITLKFDSTIIKQITPSSAKEKDVFSQVDLDFVKKTDVSDISLWQRFINWLASLIFGNDNYESVGNSTRVLFWIVVVIGLIVIIWALTKVNFTRYFKSSAKKNTFNFTDIEEDISGINFAEKINLAIKENNFRLAIRWHYLKQLNTLNETNKITWLPYKTNIDYSNELIKTTIYPQFKDISRIYDYAWYGEYKITPTTYIQFEKQFAEFEKLINV